MAQMANEHWQFCCINRYTSDTHGVKALRGAAPWVRGTPGSAAPQGLPSAPGRRGYAHYTGELYLSLLTHMRQLNKSRKTKRSSLTFKRSSLTFKLLLLSTRSSKAYCKGSHEVRAGVGSDGRRGSAAVQFGVGFSGGLGCV